jgi:RNA polymerase sigma-70 factor (ECF subfamily)
MDTAMGGERTRFPATSLSLYRNHDGGVSREYLERVGAAYWKPIYCFIRRAWSKTDTDAKDLTQSFFVHLLESDVLSRFDGQRGNFRTFLKQCLRHFLSSEARARERLKRGGGLRIVPMNGEWTPEAAEVGSPEEQFDRDWIGQLLDHCRAETEAQLRAEGKGAYVDALHLYAEDDTASYRTVGERLGLSESDVRNRLRLVRQRFRQVVIEAVNGYVFDREELLKEVASVLGGR